MLLVRFREKDGEGGEGGWEGGEREEEGELSAVVRTRLEGGGGGLALSEGEEEGGADERFRSLLIRLVISFWICSFRRHLPKWYKTLRKRRK